MNPLLILLIGMAVVIGGILLLRLHAFLSLLAGGLVVAILTPNANIYRFTLRSGGIDVSGADVTTRTVYLKAKQKLLNGTPLLVLEPSPAAPGYKQIATLRAGSADADGRISASIVSGNPPLPLPKDDFVIESAKEATARETAAQTIGERIGIGFGNTARDVGILIALAAVIGKCLMESGAAERIVCSLRRGLGDEHAGVAFAISGFVLASLVLSDTCFYLLIPVAQVMRLRSGRDYLLYILGIVSGSVMSHSLVPPAAGPTFVAAELHVNLATMILIGTIVGGIAAASGYLYALWANRRWVIPLRPTVGVSEADLAEIAQRDESTLPPLSLSLVPILIPVLLIGGAAIVMDLHHEVPGARLIRTLGEKNLALAIAAAIALLMVRARYRGHGSKRKVSHAAAEALGSAGVMVLMISAGGAFGYMLRQSDIAATIKQLVPISKYGLLPLAWLVAVCVRTSGGSAIVSMVTTAGIVGPLAAGNALGYNPVYLAAAIGCGSKPILWMNDAGFWIIGKMSGMTEAETLKSATILMCIMGTVGLGVTMLLAWVWPM